MLPAERFGAVSAETGAILLETQRPGPGDRHSFLLHSPLKILASRRPEDVLPVLEEAADWQERGYLLAGFLSYEAGYALEESLAPGGETGGGAGGSDFPLAWFGVYGGALRFDHFRGRWSEMGPSPPDWPSRGEGADVLEFAGRIEPEFSLAEADHAEKVGAIRRAIANGDVYQANLTGKFAFPFDAGPFALYMRLRAVQPVRYGAFLRTEDGCVVSRSPELFFRIRGGRIETRPMKGTAPRGLTAAEDRRAAAALRTDPKNRAENVMIVDLLRNDLGRVCLAGTVQVPRLFAVERYRTVLQMVSAVTGALKPGVGLPSLMRALFPCGSVTGAPKISSMRLLRKLEGGPRGIYTGAVGILLPGGDMTFSVAIRTVAVRNGRAEAGSGGGIVWDSEPASEFGEALLKGRYLVDPPVGFQLIETFLWSRETGFRFLEDHLRRLSASAGYFGFRFRKERVRAALDSAAREWRDAGARKIRLLLDKGGDLSVEASPVAPPGENAEPLRVRISKTVVSSRDPFVRHKTTNRGWRDDELRAAAGEGFDEVLFLNERGELTEGAVTNLFLEIGGSPLTPPASCGLLEGIFRRRILTNRNLGAREKVLRPEDLEKATGILLTNSVRGVRRAGGGFRHGA